MKKRAILEANNYEEFKNLVSCATLEAISPQEYNFHHEHVHNEYATKENDICIFKFIK